MLLGSLSCHNKDLERVTALESWTDRVIALRQISVTAPLYLEDSRKIHLRGVRVWQKDTYCMGVGVGGERERERANPLVPLFICFLTT